MALDSLSCIRSFVAVVEHQGFAAAARRLFVSPPVLTKQIKCLETQLGKSLLIRTTRRFELTPAGVLYYDHARVILQKLEDAKNAIVDLDKELQGKLIISHAGFLNKPNLVKALQNFLIKHPKVTLEIRSIASAEILLNGEIDVCVTNQKWQNIGLIQDLFYTDYRRLYAAPAYINQYGTPKNIQDLVNHKCLFFSHAKDEAYEWSPSSSMHIPYTGQYITDSHGHFEAMLLSGFGMGWCVQTV